VCNLMPLLMVYSFFGRLFALVPYVRCVLGGDHLGMGANFW
jgi:hypothetical protein